MSVSRIQTRAALAVAALFLLPAAHAHVTLELKQAPIESRYKAVFKVSHGCEGSPTTRIRVRVPEGVLSVTPQTKAGWTLETVKGEYARPYTLYGAQVSSGVKEVAWSGGPLPDDHYDEFVFVGYLSSALQAGTSLYFPVVQECEQGVARWIDLPSSDKPAAGHHSGSPAPGLKLLPKP